MRLEVQRPDKELWKGVSKADLARHMVAAADVMLPHLKDRPMTLVRAPDGIDGQRFFQKDAHHLAKHLETCTFDGVDYVLARSADDLVRLADMAVVELHGWVSRCDQPDVPDRIVFDLDPPSSDEFDDVRIAARDLCRLLRKRGATPFPMLSGSKGIHVTVPLEREAPFADVVSFTNAVARVMTRHNPRLTTELRKDKRQGRIFVDTLRNRPRQTAVMPWSPRAKEGAPFALPILIEDLDDADLHPQAAHVGEAEGWLRRKAWEGFFDAAVPLSRIN